MKKWRVQVVEKVIAAGIGLAWVTAVVWLALGDARESWRAKHDAAHGR